MRQPPSEVAGLLRRLLDGLQRILGVTLDDPTWRRLTLDPPAVNPYDGLYAVPADTEPGQDAASGAAAEPRSLPAMNDFFDNPEKIKALEEHIATCEICKAAASQREACEVGKGLYEEMVIDAHERKAATS
jgi:hypothetical protein